MANAAKISDLTSHGGSIVGPGAPSVLINGLPAAVLGDRIFCVIPPLHHAFCNKGSASVFINGKPAIRQGDSTSCGAVVISGSGNVNIG